MPAKKPAKAARKPSVPKPKSKPAAKAIKPSPKASTTAKRPARPSKPANTPKPARTTLAAPPTKSVSRTNSKQSQLIAKLSEDAGLTIPQMVALTGWQAHSVRGTISGVLRKKLGLNVTCSSFADSGERIYCINGAVPA